MFKKLLSTTGVGHPSPNLFTRTNVVCLQKRSTKRWANAPSRSWGREREGFGRGGRLVVWRVYLDDEVTGSGGDLDETKVSENR